MSTSKLNTNNFIILYVDSDAVRDGLHAGDELVGAQRGRAQAGPAAARGVRRHTSRAACPSVNAIFTGNFILEHQNY